MSAQSGLSDLMGKFIFIISKAIITRRHWGFVFVLPAALPTTVPCRARIAGPAGLLTGAQFNVLGTTDAQNQQRAGYVVSVKLNATCQILIR